MNDKISGQVKDNQDAERPPSHSYVYAVCAVAQCSMLRRVCSLVSSLLLPSRNFLLILNMGSHIFTFFWTLQIM